jgi:hypothetical protein
VQFLLASLVGGPAVVVGATLSGACVVIGEVALAIAGGAAIGWAAYELQPGDVGGLPEPLPPPAGQLVEPRPPSGPLHRPTGFRCPPGALCRMIVVVGGGGLITFYYVIEAMNRVEPRPEPGPAPSDKSQVLRP